MGSLFTGCDCGTRAIWTPPVATMPTPTPDNFIVHRAVLVGDLWVSRIEYPGCVNYEGLKVLVTDFDPRHCSSLDPHFLEGNGIIARFVPTPEGFAMALDFAEGVAFS